MSTPLIFPHIERSFAVFPEHDTTSAPHCPSTLLKPVRYSPSEQRAPRTHTGTSSSRASDHFVLDRAFVGPHATKEESVNRRSDEQMEIKSDDELKMTASRNLYTIEARDSANREHQRPQSRHDSWFVSARGFHDYKRHRFTRLTDTSMILLPGKNPRPCCNSDIRWSHYMITHFFSLPPRPLTLPPPPLPPPEPIDPGPVIPK